MDEKLEKKLNTDAGCFFYGSAVSIGLEAVRSYMYAANYHTIELQSQLQKIALPVGIEERLSSHYHQGLMLSLAAGLCVAMGTYYFTKKE